MTRAYGIENVVSSEKLPLPPNPSATVDCLVGRLHRIHELLLRRRFSDHVASKAVDEVLDVGQKAISSGKAARMSGKQRAAWLWTVALNAARRASSREIAFISLTLEPIDFRGRMAEPECAELCKALRQEIDLLTERQKQAVVLHGLQSVSYRMAAREMGVCASTVGHHYNAGIASLMSALRAMIGKVQKEKSCYESGARAS